MTTTNNMPITALAPWFGGKRTLAPKIIAELGPHRAYWEPFCGGVSVLMAKPVARMETINDLHGDMINLARVMQHRTLGVQFYRQARRLVVADDQLRAFDAEIRSGEYVGIEPDLDRAVAFFATSWMGRNGEVGLAKNERGRQLAVRWTPNGGDSATRFQSAVTSIPAWRLRLRDVLILRRDAFGVIEKIRDEQGTVIYIDPPYIEKSDTYAYDFDAGFMGEDDHGRLARLVRRFKKTRVVVSYYAHPRVAELYEGWNVIDCAMNKNMAAVTGGRPAKAAPEVLIINGPSLAAGVAA